MDSQIALLLGQDGLTSGAIYALLALSLVLVFSITRVLLVPQGEFVTFGAMAMAGMQAGKPAALAWLLLGLAALRLVLMVPAALRSRRLPAAGSWGMLAYALALLALLHNLQLQQLPMAVQALLALAMVVPMGPLFYDIVFRPIASAHALVLLIASIALHGVLVGVSLLMFGAEGARSEPFAGNGLELGPVTFKAQTLWVIGVTLALLLALYAFFNHTLYGKALRATAVQRLGAELMGISTAFAGQASFALAAFIGCLSGILIAPLTTLYFDSGFLIALKGFVGAVTGGMASYPVAALGASGIGLVESFSTFWASDYKEVIVFTLILPFLLWRSLTTRHTEEEA
ncbi:branched-chain amino acid ABC transporter permease [Acidovorax sp. CCYZU-2555]|uniref:branched-chain amino acid ABC transporter permease n=1 Tax=Acidovorax sp. CCYZU-2555 TaxID=2835042 RepID=UPI001BCB686D|nr:branched-chain amino acid ABC transporter permease [Acidovorax sp. CCYZU-2555]MBS7781352.1 branched-chain amino acid ABC transporter permease [Acidovorax sp. CCYZU-2555]